MSRRLGSGALTALFVIGLGALLAGCHKPGLPLSRSPGSTACGDPCAAMVCPGGSECTWNDSCQPRCDLRPSPAPFVR